MTKSKRFRAGFLFVLIGLFIFQVPLLSADKIKVIKSRGIVEQGYEFKEYFQLPQETMLIFTTDRAIAGKHELISIVMDLEKFKAKKAKRLFTIKDEALLAVSAVPVAAQSSPAAANAVGIAFVVYDANPSQFQSTLALVCFPFDAKGKALTKKPATIATFETPNKHILQTPSIAAATLPDGAGFAVAIMSQSYEGVKSTQLFQGTVDRNCKRTAFKSIALPNAGTGLRTTVLKPHADPGSLFFPLQQFDYGNVSVPMEVTGSALKILAVTKISSTGPATKTQLFTVTEGTSNNAELYDCVQFVPGQRTLFYQKNSAVVGASVDEQIAGISYHLQDFGISGKRKGAARGIVIEGEARTFDNDLKERMTIYRDQVSNIVQTEGGSYQLVHLRQLQYRTDESGPRASKGNPFQTGLNYISKLESGLEKTVAKLVLLASEYSPKQLSGDDHYYKPSFRSAIVAATLLLIMEKNPEAAQYYKKWAGILGMAYAFAHFD